MRPREVSRRGIDKNIPFQIRDYFHERGQKDPCHIQQRAGTESRSSGGPGLSSSNSAVKCAQSKQCHTRRAATGVKTEPGNTRQNRASRLPKRNLSESKREREGGRARMEETEQHKTREDLQRSARPNERLISGTRAPGWETSRRGPGRARSRSSRRRRSSRRPRTGPASPCPALAPGRRRRPLVPSSRGAAAAPRARGREHSTPAPVASSSLSLDC
jgi:hypothetical protein